MISKTSINIITTTNRINKVKAFVGKLKSRSMRKNWKNKLFKKGSVTCNQFRNKILRSLRIVCSFFYLISSVSLFQNLLKFLIFTKYSTS